MEFEWDKGNSSKNLNKHDVSDQEAEEAFFDRDKVQHSDLLHSQLEKRFFLIGKTKNHKLLYVAYTKRDKKIRIISAKQLNKKEKYLYEKSA